MVGTPEVLLDTKSYDRNIDVADTKVLIGHCRAKTFGAVNRANAHPFEHSHIIGVHNGTLDKDYGLPQRRDFDVDSDWLFWHMSQHGVRETVSIIEGAWALNWWDDQSKTLNFLRNDQRPLFFTHSENMKTMYWASEAWMLGAVGRTVKLWDGGETKSVYYPLATNTLMSYEIDGKGKTPQEVFKLNQPVEIKSEVRSYVGNVTHYRGSAGASYGNNSNVSRLPSQVQGGKVADPFPKTIVEDPMNATIDDLMDKLEARRQAKKDSTSLVVVSPTTNTGGTKSSNGTPTVSGHQTGSTNSSSTQKPRLSLRLSTSETSQQENNGKTSSASNEKSGCCNDHKHSKSSIAHRTVGGLHFITDKKSKIEFSYRRFEELTNGECCYCNTHIEEPRDIHEIFVRDGILSPKTVSFICDSCVVPVVA